MRIARPTLALAVCALVSACGTPGAPVPPSLQLPRPVRDLSATRVGDNITFTFTLPAELTDGSRVKRLGSTLIVRCEDASCEKHTAVREVPFAEAKPAGQIRVELPVDLTSASPVARYAAVVNNDRGRNAGVSNITAVPTIPALVQPQQLTAEMQANRVELHLTPARPELSEHAAIGNDGCTSAGACYSYSVDRIDRSDAQARPVHLADIPAGADLADSSFEWEQRYTYSVRAMNSIAENGKKLSFTSGPPLSVDVLTHDVFAPATPAGLAAVFTPAADGQRGSIDLNWDPNTERDLAGYNIYRTDASGNGIKINAELVKTPAFRDTNVTAGASYRYSVAAVDLRGNESARSAAVSESVPAQ